jgi:hypothetical protein
MMSQLEPLRFWSRAKGAQRTDDPVTWASFGGYRLNQQMIGVGFTAESALGTLDKQWCLYNQLQKVPARKKSLKLVTIIGIFRITML